MKKIVFALLVVCCCLISVPAHAADWSQFETITNNQRLEGYKDMPGYVAFGDGAGNVLGIMWMSPGQGLVWCSVGNGTSYVSGSNPDDDEGLGVINLETTKLTNAYGVPIASNWSGTLPGVAF